MLTSINPLGQRGRGHRWGSTVTLFCVASVAGGATTGLALGALGDVVSLPVWVGVIACAAAALLDLSDNVPSLRRQVDEDWLVRYRPWVYACGFGWQLGTAVTTIVTSAVTYALLVLMVVSGLPTAVLAGALFGLCRALPLLLGRRADSPEGLRVLARRVENWRRPVQLLTAGAAAASALTLALS